MVLFKCDVLTHLAYVISTLHSTMVLFKYEYRVLVSSYEYLYIPLWFYSNTTPVTQRTMTYLLYIPLWFYSNQDLAHHKLNQNNFTFHYGSIQILSLLRKGKTSYVFTFHYGSIQIQSKGRLCSQVLHFTFHYGSIQIFHRVLFRRWNTAFTFHYGSIQISRTINHTNLKPTLHSTMVLFKF